jgi:hypothetical protein
MYLAQLNFQCEIMSEPLNTMIVGAAQGAAITIAGVSTGMDVHMVQILVGGIVGALGARIFAPVPDIPVGYAKGFAIFLCSIIMAVLIGGFAIELAVAKAWFTDSFYARLSVGFSVGVCAQGIVEFVQAVPKLAQSNLVDAVKAIFARFTGKGVQ